MKYPFHWLGHSGIRIDGSKRVYIDPYQIGCDDPADVILITHEHYDHFSKVDILKISTVDTILVKPGMSRNELSVEQRTVIPGQQFELQGVSIQTVPSYNIGKPFHPSDSHNVGYVFSLDDVTYYHAGDTDLIPEMTAIQCDVAFLPVGGTYTMNPEEAAKAAEILRPKMAVPIHWGSVVGTRRDAETFSKLCSCDVNVPELYP
ncbi:MBL fold metallo-hydrolase [candidate division KSB1 bacterium]|nr:MBL fold metallo-hydrolase [candidate division KSB1 bacterium]